MIKIEKKCTNKVKCKLTVFRKVCLKLTFESELRKNRVLNACNAYTFSSQPFRRWWTFLRCRISYSATTTCRRHASRTTLAARSTASGRRSAPLRRHPATTRSVGWATGSTRTEVCSRTTRRRSRFTSAGCCGPTPRCTASSRLERESLSRRRGTIRRCCPVWSRRSPNSSKVPPTPKVR